MVYGSEGLQGHLRAPRVPFDLKCLILATAGFLTLGILNSLLASWWDVKNPVGQLVGYVIESTGFFGLYFAAAASEIRGVVFHESADLSWWQAGITSGVWLLVWSYFGGAIMRTVSLRLTRDEPITLKQSLSFSTSHLRDYLMAPVLVLLIVLFFAACNAMAGFLIAIPFVGSTVLVILLFPLVLLSTLALTLALIAGVFGLPLMWAGLAVEVNGPLEALSRAYSYIFARPLQFLFGYMLLSLLAALVLLVGSHFETALADTAGYWMFGELGAAVRTGLSDWETVDGLAGHNQFGFAIMWALNRFAAALFNGYTLYVFLGGSASLYLLLRRGVDGTDEEEIFVARREEDAGDSEKARWVGDSLDKNAMDEVDPGKG